MPSSRTRPRSSSARPSGPREDDVYIDLTSPTSSTRPDLPAPPLPSQRASRQQQMLPPIVPSSASFNFEPQHNYHFDPPYFPPPPNFNDSDPSPTDQYGVSISSGRGMSTRSSVGRRGGNARSRLQEQSNNNSSESDLEAVEGPFYSRVTTPLPSSSSSSRQVRTRGGNNQADVSAGRESKRRRLSPSGSLTPGPSPSAGAMTSRRAPNIPVADDVDEVDLVEVDDEATMQSHLQEEMVRSQERGSGKRRIADFKCVICLDEPTELSATTCGHLFCNQCIKTTLRYNQPNPANVKTGKCPVCRQKVNMKEIIPLELKLKRTPKGKGKARA